MFDNAGADMPASFRQPGYPMRLLENPTRQDDKIHSLND